MYPFKYKFAFYPLVFFLILFLSKGCSSELKLEEARDKTGKLFQKELKKENVHNAFLMVYSPSQQIDWNFAGGEFQNGEAVSAANPFYTASIGKTFTATAIAILVEQNKLKFEDKISICLSDSILK